MERMHEGQLWERERESWGALVVVVVAGKWGAAFLSYRLCLFLWLGTLRRDNREHAVVLFIF